MSEDLGLSSRPLTELFPRPENIEDWLSYCLSEDQLLEFNENGFIHGIKVLNYDQLEVIRKELNEIVVQEHEGREFFYEYHSNESTIPETVLFHALGAWRVRKSFHDLLWNPAFLIPAYQLLGNGFRFFHDQIFCKPAYNGSVVSWHQDFSYWTWTQPMNHLTCWIGLDDVDRENGCMYYIPKSHKWGLLEKESLTGDMDAIREKLTPEQVADFDNKIPVEMNAGEASFHHPLLMHGSYENRSDRKRRATLINVFSDGVISNRDNDGSNAPGADNYPSVPRGAKMGGSYYPLLVDAEKTFAQIKGKLPTIKDL